MTLCVFQSTLPARGATHPAQHQDNDTQHFNPRSPHGERHTFRCWLLRLGIFQSTLPARGATRAAQHQQKCNLISIHAPRTGSDEHDLSVPCLRRQFQSTLPARGATNHNSRSSYACHISIHAPRTGSDPRDATHLHQHHISIHAPRTGSDSPDESRERNRPISIHAPRTGSDGTRRSSCGSRSNFNPRSPHGERLLAAYGFRMAGVFQSTLPARGATDADVLFLCNVEFQSTLPARGATRVTKAECLDLPISIHAPRTGSDPCTKGGGADPAHFNPRSPHGERHGACAVADTIKRFQSTLHARGATGHWVLTASTKQFQSTLPARGAT